LFGWKSEEAIGRTGDGVIEDKISYSGGREEALAAFEKEGFWQGEVIYHTKG
jgi:hypothetical protein